MRRRLAGMVVVAATAVLATGGEVGAVPPASGPAGVSSAVPDGLAAVGNPVVIVGDQGPEDVKQDFGSRVALDGDTLLVKSVCFAFARNCFDDVYVFVRSGDDWVQQAKITPPSDVPGESAYIGGIAISGDTAVVGVESYTPSMGGLVGSVRLYVRSGSTWTEQATLREAYPQVDARFGSEVGIDGDTMVVGAQGRDVRGTPGAGAAYVFVRSGTSWSAQARLTVSGSREYDYFGRSVAVDGDNIVVGAENEDAPGGEDAGAAYAFARSGTAWSQTARITPPDAARNDHFGAAVALDGLTSVIGIDRDYQNRVERAYVYVHDGSSWQLQARLLNDAPGDEQFGTEVAVSGDTVVVGAFNDSIDVTWQGSASLYTRTGDQWSKRVRLTAADPEYGDDFGNSIALDGQTLAVAAVYYHDEGGTVFVYER